VRIYLPATMAGLARLRDDGSLPASAERYVADGDSEEQEYAALMAAATESAELVEANIGVAEEHKVKDTIRWNLAGTWTGVKSLTLKLGIRNLFDEEPPFTASSSYGSHAAGYAASFADPRGRFFYGVVTYQFK